MTISHLVWSRSSGSAQWEAGGEGGTRAELASFSPAADRVILLLLWVCFGGGADRQAKATCCAARCRGMARGMNKCVFECICVCSRLDEQTVSGLREVPASLGAEGARKERGWGGDDSQEKTEAKIS